MKQWELRPIIHVHCINHDFGQTLAYLMTNTVALAFQCKRRKFSKVFTVACDLKIGRYK